MDNLLDTHAVIWFINGEEALSKNARKVIESNSAGNYVSIASLWEIAIKVSLNKLELKRPYQDIHHLIISNAFKVLSISFDDTSTISALPFHHRDPFDRIIVAQALNTNLQVISKDEILKLYGIPIVR